MNTPTPGSAAASPPKRPLSITIIGCVYIAVGAIGFVYHASEFNRQPFQYDIVWIEGVRLLAVVAGVYMLRGHNWARWLALAWIASHVALSAFNGIAQVAMHTLFFAVLAYFLMRSTASRYFRGGS